MKLCHTGSVAVHGAPLALAPVVGQAVARAEAKEPQPWPTTHLQAMASRGAAAVYVVDSLAATVRAKKPFTFGVKGTVDGEPEATRGHKLDVTYAARYVLLRHACGPPA